MDTTATAMTNDTHTHTHTHTHTPHKSRQRILIVGNLGYIGPVLTKYFKNTEPNSKLIGLDTGYFVGCLIDPYTSYDHQLDHQIY